MKKISIIAYSIRLKTLVLFLIGASHFSLAQGRSEVSIFSNYNVFNTTLSKTGQENLDVENEQPSFGVQFQYALFKKKYSLGPVFGYAVVSQPKINRGYAPSLPSSNYAFIGGFIDIVLTSRISLSADFITSIFSNRAGPGGQSTNTFKTLSPGLSYRIFRNRKNSIFLKFKYNHFFFTSPPETLGALGSYLPAYYTNAQMTNTSFKGLQIGLSYQFRALDPKRGKSNKVNLLRK